MVYVKSALAGAVALSIVSSVSALPTGAPKDNGRTGNNGAANGNSNRHPVIGANMSKRDGPMVVEAKYLQPAKRDYVAGGSAEKQIRQAPLVKTSKLFRSKRNIVEARDHHTNDQYHDHEHYHGHHHGHYHDDHYYHHGHGDEHHDRHHHDDRHEGLYDPHHSKHYNEHHNLGHREKRSLVNVQALNFDSPIGNKSVKKINNSKTVKVKHVEKKIQKCSGSHYHCDNNHKRSEQAGAEDGDANEHDGNPDDYADDESGEDGDEGAASRLVRRRKSGGHRKGRHGGRKGRHGSHSDFESEDHHNKRKKKSKGSAGHKHKMGGGNDSKEGDFKPGSKLKAHAAADGGDLHKRDIADESSSHLEARHRHHHSASWWRHYRHNHDQSHVHAHIHSHEHKRDLAERHHDHDDWYYYRHGRHGYDRWLDDMTHHREWKNGHAHIHVHGHSHREKRDLAGAGAAGIPGFVEVASTLFHSNLVKSVAGLVFSKDSNASSSDFILGTSEAHSTQFYLVPAAASVPDSLSQQLDALPVNATAAPVNVDNVESNVATQMYELRIPVLDSKTLEKNDYCATFDVQPPSPLSMEPCGVKEGFSQSFNYNATSGELVPVYPDVQAPSTPLDAAVNFAAMPAPQNATATVGSAAGAVASTVASSEAADEVTHDDDSSMAPKVSLFFIPSDAAASAVPAPMASVASPTDAANAVFSAPAQIKAAATGGSQDQDQEDAQQQPQEVDNDDQIDGNDMDNQEASGVTVVTTTVVVTSTVDAAAEPTPTSTGDSSAGADSMTTSASSATS